MKYCKNCKADLVDGLLYCKNCGTKNEVDQSTEASQTAETPQEEMTKRSNKNPKKKKFGMIALFSAIVLLAIGHFTIEHFLDPRKQIKDIGTAVSNSDKDALLKEISIQNDVLYDGKSYTSYLKSLKWNDVENSMIAALNEISNDSLASSTVEYEDNELFIIKQESFLLGLYTKYVIEAVPSDLKLKSEPEELTITIDSKTKVISNEYDESFAKVLPGKFKWKSSLDSPFGKVEETGKLDIESSPESNSFEEEIDYSPEYLSVYSNAPSADIFINDKKTSMKISDYSALVGPFAKDAKVKVYAKLSTGEKTNEVSINLKDEASANLNFKHIISKEKLEKIKQKYETSIEEQIKNFGVTHSYAVESASFQNVDGFLTKDSPLRETLPSYFNSFLEVSNPTMSDVEYDVTDIDAISKDTLIARVNISYNYTEDIDKDYSSEDDDSDYSNEDDDSDYSNEDDDSDYSSEDDESSYATVYGENLDYEFIRVFTIKIVNDEPLIHDYKQLKRVVYDHNKQKYERGDN